MRKLHYLLFALIMGLSVSMTSCSDDDDGPAGPSDETNATIADIKALYSSEIVTIGEDKIFDAIVVSNYASKNFYQRVIVQDETGGLELKNYKSDFLEALVPGQKIIVRAKDLFIGKYGESIQLGVKFEDKVGGMSDVEAIAHVEKVDGGLMPTAQVIDLAALDMKMINTVVTLENVQFITNELNKKTFANKAGDFKYSENRTLINSDKKTIILRTANTALFADTEFPVKRGSVTGILSKFKEDWQLYISYADDVTMTAERFDDGTTEVVDPIDPVDPSGFSNWGLENWTDDTNPVGFGEKKDVKKESTNIHGGSFSAKVEAPASGKNIISFEVPVEAGATYEVSFWYLDNDVNAKGRMWSYFNGTDVVVPDDAKALIQSQEYTEDNAAWQQYKVEVVVPANATNLKFATRTYKGEAGGGFIYYDDFAVVKK